MAWLYRPASIYVIGDNGQLILKASQNINLIASDIGNLDAGSQIAIIVGKDINLVTGNVSLAFDYNRNSDNYYRGKIQHKSARKFKLKGS